MDEPKDHSEHAILAGSGFAQRMGWGSRPALCMIDVCKAYWTPGSPLDTSSNPASAASPESMRRLLAAAREGGVPVIWTQVSYTRPDMADAGIFWLKSKNLNVWQKGDPRGLDAWMPGLEPGPEDTVIVKKYPSAFFGTDLATSLHFMNVDTLVLCGVSTSGCVRASTLDAMQYGYKPIVVGSACGDRSPEIQNANLFDLNAKYADVVEEAEAVDKLRTGWLSTAA
ncbi:putative N-carbamoylsarcosine amidase [Saccharata proteae CBS 121410]|uniref:N-carbamoylsarcosine amidase n=1 Tax=Saccharata proteae CBS 121410 TaxID=1314787 RepID=A0A9P4HSB2_9PEZI|nr:putative N-carbamoylsarcosine amidase [Saccharata proteae CBS 121410]